MKTKSHITQLVSIATKLAHKLTMTGTIMVLNEKNKKLVEQAEAQIYDTIYTLQKVTE